MATKVFVPHAAQLAQVGLVVGRVGHKDLDGDDVLGGTAGRSQRGADVGADDVELLDQRGTADLAVGAQGGLAAEMNEPPRAAMTAWA